MRPRSGKSGLPIPLSLCGQYFMETLIPVPSRPVVPSHLLGQYALDHPSADPHHIGRLDMASTSCVESLAVYRQLLVPTSELPVGVPAPRHSQDRISLSEHVLVLLKRLKVTLFHVKQGPIEYPTAMFAAFQKRLEPFRRDHHDRQSPGQLGHRPDSLTIYPKAGMAHPLLDTDRTVLSARLILDPSKNRRCLHAATNHRTRPSRPKGTAKAQEMNRLQKARLPATVRADQQVHTGIRIDVGG